MAGDSPATQAATASADAPRTDDGAVGAPRPSGTSGPALRWVIVVLAPLAVGMAWIFLGRSMWPAGPTTVAEPTTFHSGMASPQLLAYLEPFVSAAQSNPNDMRAHSVLGQVYAANRRWSEARSALSRAVALDPDALMPRYYLGIALTKLGEYAEALRQLGEVARRHPDFAPGYQRYGDALLEAAKVDESILVLEKALALAPRATPVMMGLADAKIRLRKFDEAAQHAAAALDINPRDPTAHFLYGMALRELGRSDEAAFALRLGADNRKAYMADPWTDRLAHHCKSIEHQLSTARRLILDGDATRAIALLEDLAAWYPDNFTVRNQLASAFRQLGQFNRSLEMIQGSMELSDDSAESVIELARHYMEAGDLDAALQETDRAVEMSPSSYTAHRMRGYVLRKLNRPQEALAAWRKALKIFPLDSTTQLSAAMLASGLGQHEAAHDYLVQAIRHDPLNIQPRIALTETLLALGQSEEAARNLERARRIAPGDARVESLAARINQVGNSTKP
ncbi:MAG: tetratricopeptide repeat protein [Planctomycetota bacterium]|jgi:tetratricopeptide (TPR) repeat protein